MNSRTARLNGTAPSLEHADKLVSSYTVGCDGVDEIAVDGCVLKVTGKRGLVAVPLAHVQYCFAPRDLPYLPSAGYVHVEPGQDPSHGRPVSIPWMPTVPLPAKQQQKARRK